MNNEPQTITEAELDELIYREQGYAILQGLLFNCRSRKKQMAHYNAVCEAFNATGKVLVRDESGLYRITDVGPLCWHSVGAFGFGHMALVQELIDDVQTRTDFDGTDSPPHDCDVRLTWWFLRGCECLIESSNHSPTYRGRANNPARAVCLAWLEWRTDRRGVYKLVEADAA